jgi:uncharacterized protein YgiM (DUF1202 family)
MTARVINHPAKVYEVPDSKSSPFTELKVGTEVELGKTKKKGGNTWVAVSFANGQNGYLPGDTEIFQIRLVMLREDKVNIYSEPSASSSIKTSCGRNTKLFLTDLVSHHGRTWVKIRDADGNDGYIDSQTKIKTITLKTKAVGKKNMLYGCLWLIGGITVMGILFSSKSSGGDIFFITLGVILLGLIIFFQGLYQYFTAPS